MCNSTFVECTYKSEKSRAGFISWPSIGKRKAGYIPQDKKENQLICIKSHTHQRMKERDDQTVMNVLKRNFIWIDIELWKAAPFLFSCILLIPVGKYSYFCHI